VVFTLEAVSRRIVVFAFLEWRPTDTEVGVRSKLADQELKIVRLERHVAIDIAYDLKIQVLDPGIARIERLHLCSETPVDVFWPVDHFNPLMLAGNRVGDLRRAVRRAVVDNDPLLWPMSLRYN